MFKTIVSVHYNRPYYTRRCIAALERLINIDEYVVYFHVDPGSQEVVDIINDSKLNKEVCVNHRRLGFGYNMVHSFTHGFSNSDYVICVEDDIILASDALLYFEYANQFRADQSILSVTTYNRLQQVPSSEYYFKIDRRSWYHGWGVALWIDRWTMLLESGCQWNIMDVDILRRFVGQRNEVFPILSRCQNIGVVHGMNTSNTDAKIYQELMHLKYWYGNLLPDNTTGEFYG